MNKSESESSLHSRAYLTLSGDRLSGVVEIDESSLCGLITSEIVHIDF